MKSLYLGAIVITGLTAAAVILPVAIGLQTVRACGGIAADCLEMALCSWTVCDD